MTDKLKKLSYDKEFINTESKDEKVYSCFCGDIRLFFIHWETDTYGKNKNGYWWIEEHYFKSTIFNKFGKQHPINDQIKLYLRVPMKTKKEVMDACEHLFKIYTGLFFEPKYKLKKSKPKNK